MLRKFVVVAVLASLMIFLAVSSALAQVETHGFAQIRSLVTDGPNSNYKTRIDRLGVRFTETLNDEFDYLTEIYIHPPLYGIAGQDVIYTESAYVNWNLEERLPWDISVRFGKGRNFTYGIAPSYGNRRTSDYSLYSQAFTQSRVLGIQTFSQITGNISLGVAVLNGYCPVIGGRQVPDLAISDFIRVPIGDAETNSALTSGNNKRVALSSRLGYKNDLFNVGVSAYVTETDNQDTNTMNRFGFDGEIKHETGLMGQVQFTMATTAVDLNGNGTNEEIDHSGVEVLAGYEMDQIGIYSRYSMLAYDNDDIRDMNQIMLSAIYKIHPRVHFRLEALINSEEEDTAKGWDDVSNNVLFFETLLAW